jgi:hypothetical protein
MDVAEMYSGNWKIFSVTNFDCLILSSIVMVLTFFFISFLKIFLADFVASPAADDDILRKMAANIGLEYFWFIILVEQLIMVSCQVVNPVSQKRFSSQILFW